MGSFFTSLVKNTLKYQYNVFSTVDQHQAQSRPRERAFAWMIIEDYSTRPFYTRVVLRILEERMHHLFYIQEIWNWISSMIIPFVSDKMSRWSLYRLAGYGQKHWLLTRLWTELTTFDDLNLRRQPVLSRTLSLIQNQHVTTSSQVTMCFCSSKLTFHKKPHERRFILIVSVCPNTDIRLARTIKYNHIQSLLWNKILKIEAKVSSYHIQEH